jgi:hypothetical protein
MCSDSTIFGELRSIDCIDSVIVKACTNLHRQRYRDRFPDRFENLLEPAVVLRAVRTHRRASQPSALDIRSFTSRISAPLPAPSPAAMHMRSGWPPKICTANGRSVLVKPHLPFDFGLLRVRPSTEMNSKQTDQHRHASSTGVETRRQSHPPLAKAPMAD